MEKTDRWEEILRTQSELIKALHRQNTMKREQAKLAGQKPQLAPIAAAWLSPTRSRQPDKLTRNLKGGIALAPGRPGFEAAVRVAKRALAERIAARVREGHTSTGPNAPKRASKVPKIPIK